METATIGVAGLVSSSGDSAAIWFARRLVNRSISRSKGTNVAPCSDSNNVDSSARHDSTICSRRPQESADTGAPCGVLPSNRSAMFSSIRAEHSSYARRQTITASGSTKPGNLRRYLRDAVRMIKRARNWGSHFRMRSRTARSCCREGSSSRRTPVGKRSYAIEFCTDRIAKGVRALNRQPDVI